MWEPRALPRSEHAGVPLSPNALAAAVAGPRGAAAAHALGAAVIVTDDDAAALTSPPAHGAASPDRGGTFVDLRALDAPADVAGALAHAKASLFLAQRARASFLVDGGAYVVVTSLHAGSPVSAAVHGLLKTAALEWPAVACAVVDVHSDDVAAAVAAELHAGLPDREVLVDAGGARFVPVVVERPVSAPNAAHAGGPAVVVASGGARGVTATTLLALARARRPSLLLLGRTALVDEPAHFAAAADEGALKKAIIEDKKRTGAALNLAAVGEEAKAVLARREIRAFLAQLEAVGARVLYRAVDVRDARAVAAAVDEARSAFGPITHVVHGAGVLADKKIEDKTPDQVARVMDTKVLGLAALLAATRADPLESVALFSSVAGRFGNVGQVDYAMANEALNEMAVDLQRERPDVVVKSFNWGPWEGGMVTPALMKMFAERGVRVLSHVDGARHFVDELAERDGVVEVVFGGELAPSSSTRAPASAVIHLDVHAFPYFADHAIQGTVVLPVVGALALMAKIAGTTSFADVRVLRGVRLPLFFEQGHDVVVAVDERGRCTLAVPGEKAPRYTATALPAAAPPRVLAPRLDHDAQPPAAPRIATPALYTATLFHGPRFQVVDAIDRVDDAGLVARVHGCLDAGWGHDLAVDPGVLDAALQAALLWARDRTGGAFLPTSIESVAAAAPSSSRGPLVCTLRGISCDGMKVLVDVVIENAAGVVVAALARVALHRLPHDDAFVKKPAPEARA